MGTDESGSRGLPGDVASAVKERILSGQVQPGEFVRVEPVGQSLGMSNTPVREGLLDLAAEGFVRLVPRRGFMVVSFTPDDVHDLFWAQATLAGELTARAAIRITAEELTSLEECLRHDETAFRAGDQERLAETGETFHRRIHRAARSTRLALILGTVMKHLPPRFYATLEGHVEATHDDHRMLLEALRARKPALARSLAEEHILGATEHLIEHLRKRGLWQLSEDPA